MQSRESEIQSLLSACANIRWLSDNFLTGVVVSTRCAALDFSIFYDDAF